MSISLFSSHAALHIFVLTDSVMASHIDVDCEIRPYMDVENLFRGGGGALKNLQHAKHARALWGGLGACPSAQEILEIFRFCQMASVSHYDSRIGLFEHF